MEAEAMTIGINGPMQVLQTQLPFPELDCTQIVY